MEEHITGTDAAPDAGDLRKRDDVIASAREPSHVIDDTARTAAASTETVSRPRDGWIEWIRQGLRAGTLRSVRRLPDGPGALTMLLLVSAAVVIDSAASRFEVVGPVSFDLRSWLFGWAPAALLVFGVWLILNAARDKATHASPVAAWYLLFLLATLPMGLIGVGIGILAVREGVPTWWSEGSWPAWGLYASLWVWLLVSTWRVSQAVTRSTPAVVGLLLHVLVIQLLATWQLRTQEWQAVDTGSDDDFPSLELSQGVFESQQLLLSESLQAIAPSSGDRRLTYGLVYAPYAEDVFLRESAMVQEVLEQRFAATGRVVRLVNNPATVAQLPWATTLNLERSLQALAQAMDAERDVLVVYLTSHGGADFKLAALNWPLEVEELTADQLRTILDKLGIRNRVIAVSACYSGGWIAPLQNENTLIMTAADKDHTSYGCGSKSELTYFGRAVFDEQLRKTSSFETAFKAAVPVIKQREIEARKDDGFSNPQISVGTGIRIVLDELSHTGNTR